MARETMPPPPSLAQHIIFKIVVSTISTAVALTSPFSIETARDMYGAKTSRGFAWPASTKKGESLRRRWFESQSCRVDSLQALLDDLDDLVRADAARARRATRGRAGIVAAAALGGLAAYVVLPLAL